LVETPLVDTGIYRENLMWSIAIDDIIYAVDQAQKEAQELTSPVDEQAPLAE